MRQVLECQVGHSSAVGGVWSQSVCKSSARVLPDVTGRPAEHAGAAHRKGLARMTVRGIATPAGSFRLMKPIQAREISIATKPSLDFNLDACISERRNLSNLDTAQIKDTNSATEHRGDAA